MDAAESIAGSTAGSPARSARATPPKPAGSCEPSPDTDVGLTERAQAILAFERQWWKYPGKKEQAIRELFGMSDTRYYQILNQLMESREAMVADPMLIKRLRRMRASRHRTRAAKRLGIELP